MRDVSWMIEPIQRVCDNTVQSLPEKTVSRSDKSFKIENIESILYKWSIEGKFSSPLFFSFMIE